MDAPICEVQRGEATREAYLPMTEERKIREFKPGISVARDN